MNWVIGGRLDWITVESTLIEKYEDRITVKPGRIRFNVPVISFRNVGYKGLDGVWYEQERKTNDERMRIVPIEAATIRQDIQN